MCGRARGEEEGVRGASRVGCQRELCSCAWDCESVGRDGPVFVGCCCWKLRPPPNSDGFWMDWNKDMAGVGVARVMWMLTRQAKRRRRVGRKRSPRWFGSRYLLREWDLRSSLGERRNCDACGISGQHMSMKTIHRPKALFLKDHVTYDHVMR
jgi:hypothetical protein